MEDYIRISNDDEDYKRMQRYAAKSINPKFYATITLNPCNEIPLREGNHKRYNRTEIAKEMDPVFRREREFSNEVLKLMKKIGYE
jgi:hypothetical protein